VGGYKSRIRCSQRRYRHVSVERVLNTLGAGTRESDLLALLSIVGFICQLNSWKVRCSRWTGVCISAELTPLPAVV